MFFFFKRTSAYEMRISGWSSDLCSSDLLTGVQTSPTCSPTNNAAPISPDGDCDPNNDPAGGTLLVNIGESKVSGIDIDGLLQLGEALSVNYGANFLLPKTTSFDAPPAIAPFITANEIPFNNTAKKQLTAGLRYERPVTENVGAVVVNDDYDLWGKLSYG